MLRARLTVGFLSVSLFSWSLSSAAEPQQPGPSAEEAGFVPLFDGKSIDGWVQRGGKAVYAVEDGVIIGTSVPRTANSFLCTPRDYGDFILELELNVDAGLNSGVQIRSLCFDEPTVAEGVYPNGKPFKRKVPAGRVHGYQVEIDPSSRSFSGGIYDEARRGWLNNLAGEENRAAREAFRVGEWNTYRIEARGDSIKTFVNGVPAADLTDGMTASGFIGLQVHGIGGNKALVGKQVRWRNLRIKEL
ncbi:MAG: DUF1080 domain-containing protein [Planctomycetota bacterium]